MSWYAVVIIERRWDTVRQSRLVSKIYILILRVCVYLCRKWWGGLLSLCSQWMKADLETDRVRVQQRVHIQTGEFICSIHIVSSFLSSTSTWPQGKGITPVTIRWNKFETKESHSENISNKFAWIYAKIICTQISPSVRGMWRSM